MSLVSLEDEAPYRIHAIFTQLFNGKKRLTPRSLALSRSHSLSLSLTQTSSQARKLSSLFLSSLRFSSMPGQQNGGKALYLFHCTARCRRKDVAPSYKSPADLAPCRQARARRNSPSPACWKGHIHAVDERCSPLPKAWRVISAYTPNAQAPGAPPAFPVRRKNCWECFALRSWLCSWLCSQPTAAFDGSMG